MFELIVYIFKIIIAIVVGYVLSYNSKGDNSKYFNQYSSLICFFIASIVGVLILIENFNILLIGIIFLAIIYYLIKLINEFNLEEKYVILFSSINGLIIGLGYVFYSILIALIFTYIVNNFDIIYELINNKKTSSNNKKDILSEDDDTKNDLELIEEDS